MKFKFPYRQLAKTRKIAMEEARKSYLDAQFQVDQVQERIRQMWFEIDQARKRRATSQHQEGANVSFLGDFDLFIKGNLTKIDWAKEELRIALLKAEELREVLVEAAKEYKILVRLEEKLRAKFKKEKSKKEAKILDDLVTMRQKRVGNG